MMVWELRCGYNILDEGAMWSDCDVRRRDERHEVAIQPLQTPLHFDCTRNGARKILVPDARVAELADAPDLGSGAARRGGSSPPFRTNKLGPI